METKTKIFDAVEMSRRLRENTSQLLASTSREERRQFLREARKRFAAEHAARQPGRSLQTFSS